jgi:hypothetical protein
MGMGGALHRFEHRSFEVSLTADFAHARGDVFNDRYEIVPPTIVDHDSTFADLSFAEVTSIVSSFHGFLRRRKVASHFSGRRLGSYTVIRSTSRGLFFTVHTA